MHNLSLVSCILTTFLLMHACGKQSVYMFYRHRCEKYAYISLVRVENSITFGLIKPRGMKYDSENNKNVFLLRDRSEVWCPQNLLYPVRTCMSVLA